MLIPIGGHYIESSEILSIKRIEYDFTYDGSTHGYQFTMKGYHSGNCITISEEEFKQFKIVYNYRVKDHVF